MDREISGMPRMTRSSHEVDVLKEEAAGKAEFSIVVFCKGIRHAERLRER